MSILIGCEHPDSLLTYPDRRNLSGSSSARSGTSRCSIGGPAFSGVFFKWTRRWNLLPRDHEAATFFRLTMTRRQGSESIS